MGGLFFTMGFLLAVVLLRLLIRNVWVADTLASILFSAVVLTSPGAAYEVAAGAMANLVFFYLTLWLLRRHGLVAAAGSLVLGNLTIYVPVTFGSWYAGRVLVGLFILAGISAWALWVIVSARPRALASEVS
jgi:hypothetical protein